MAAHSTKTKSSEEEFNHQGNYQEKICDGNSFERYIYSFSQKGFHHECSLGNLHEIFRAPPDGCQLLSYYIFNAQDITS